MQIVSYTNDGDNKLMFHLCVNIIIKRCLNKNTFFEPTTTYQCILLSISLSLCLPICYLSYIIQTNNNKRLPV